MYQPILDRLRHQATLFPPATGEALTQLQEALRAAGLSPLPQSYGQFLQESDGFAFNGVLFYGASDHTQPFALPSALRAHQEIAQVRGTDMGRWQVIGAADDDLFAFDRDTKAAAVLDRYTFEEVESYRSFAELFEAVIEEYS